MNRIIRVDGEPVAPAGESTVVETGPGVYSVISHGNSYEVRVTGSEIAIGPHRFHFEVDDPRQWKRSSGAADAHGRASIVAPMPGKIIRVLVSTGEAVVAGQGVVVVEAMKMQNEMKAPRDGRVTSLEVKPNDSVNAGTVLAVIE